MLVEFARYHNGQVFELLLLSQQGINQFCH